MAIIQCPECGGKVSTSAKACPHCGYPMEKKETKQDRNEIKQFPVAKEVKNPADSELYANLLVAAYNGAVEAQMQLGNLFISGTGILKQDKSHGYYWFKEAANSGKAEAQYNLGVCYMRGEGIQKNQTIGVQWIRKAAEQGIKEAQYDLAIYYHNGWGVERDLEQFFIWMKRAAISGDSDAQLTIGDCYFDGELVERDYIEANNWYCKSMEAGNAEAAFKMGRAYENGLGVAEHNALYNDLKAELYYQKAAMGGSKAGSEALAKLLAKKKAKQSPPSQTVLPPVYNAETMWTIGAGQSNKQNKFDGYSLSDEFNEDDLDSEYYDSDSYEYDAETDTIKRE